MNDDLDRVLRDVLADGLSVRLRLAEEGGEVVLALRLRLDAGETAWAIPVTAEGGLETALGEALRIGIQQAANAADAQGDGGGEGATPRSRPLPTGASFAPDQ